MNLIIDIGNTRTKLALFQNDKILKINVIKSDDLFEKVKNSFQNNKINNSIISSVAKTPTKTLNYLKKHTFCINLNHKTKIPFQNLYKTPTTLGVDRIALIAGAIYIKNKNNTLVIDAGTCITYDFINTKNEYFGGAIAPGIKMRYKAMYQNTANLPNLKPKLNYIKSGNTTKNAMHKGVINGVYLEMEGIIKQYKDQNNNLTVILTGGDTNFLADLLKSSIFANPNFLLLGLNYILNYNLQE